MTDKRRFETSPELAELYAVFLPMDRRLALARGEDMPDRVRGAALLADITGFTALTVELRAALGAKRAAEEITRNLNSVYGALIEVVHNHGGSVVGFAGDAITCWFQGDNGHRATAAAMNMTACMGSAGRITMPSGEAPTLEIKVAVVAGGARRFVVGSVQRIDTMAGVLFDRLGAALEVAHPSDVLVGAEVADALEGRLVADGFRDTDTERMVCVTSCSDPKPAEHHGPPPCGSGDAELYRPWVLPRVATLLSDVGGQFLAEVRPVVPLFVRFGGIDYDAAPDAGERLDGYVRFMQETVAELDGDLIELTIGDKGSYAYIVFGATVAHEDDALRAIRAARALLSPPESFAFGRAAQVGISAGEARTGTYGSHSRRGYGVQGRAVNVAARLMMHATPGEIMVSAQVQSSGSRHFTFEDRGEIHLKGLDRPVRAAAVTGEVGRLDRPTLTKRSRPLVGREEERATLFAALDESATGRSAAVVIVGPAGIGKSYLLVDLAEEGERRGIRVLAGATEEIEKTRPFNAWVGLLADVFGIERHERGDRVHRRVLQHLDGFGDVEAVAPLLNDVLTMSAPETPLTASLSGKVRADRTIELLVEALRRVAAKDPLVLVLEDAHWMDALSIGLLEAAVQTVPNTLIATTTRDIAGLDGLAAHGRVETVALGPLSKEGTRRLVERRLRVEAIPDQLADFIFARAEGHPFFSEEIVLALRDAELVELVDGECRVRTRHLSDIDFPDTVHGVVTSRLDRLPQPLLVLLKVASVIGQTFSLAVLAATLPDKRSRERIRADLGQLEDLDIAAQARPHPDAAYGFRHAIVRDVVYGRLLSSQRRDLHRAVGAWYESAGAEDPTRHLNVLAHHWHEVARSGRASEETVGKAIGYLQGAAGQSTRMGMAGDAVAHGVNAARLLGVDLPIAPEDLAVHIEAEEVAILEGLAGRPTSVLLELEPMEDATRGKVIEVLLEIMPAAFMAKMPELFGLAAVTNLRLTLQHGNCPATPVVHSTYAIFRRNAKQDAMGAHEYSSLALALDEQQGRHTFGACAFIHTWFIDLWKHPLRDSLPLSLRAGKAALDAGDVLYGCYNLSGYVLYAAAAGLPLSDVMQIASEQRDVIDGRVLSSTFHCVIELQYAKALSGATRHRLSMTDDEHDEQHELASILVTDQYNQMAYYHVARLKLHTYYRDWAPALEALERSLAMVGACGGQVAEMELRFFGAIALLGSHDEAPPAERSGRVARAREQAEFLRAWARNCPANFSHKAALVDAELARVEGRADEAASGYVSAARAAAANRYLQHEALALELGARHAERIGADAAVGYEAAARAYDVWGATVKARELRHTSGG